MESRDFQDVEADARGHVEIEVRVVDHVQAATGPARRGTSRAGGRWRSPAPATDRTTASQSGRATIVEESPIALPARPSPPRRPRAARRIGRRWCRGRRGRGCWPSGSGRPVVSRRRGASTSHTAIRARTPAKKPRRDKGFVRDHAPPSPPAALLRLQQVLDGLLVLLLVAFFKTDLRVANDGPRRQRRRPVSRSRPGAWPGPSRCR